MNEFDLLRQDAASRRAFLKRMTAAGLGAAAVSLFSPSFTFGSHVRGTKSQFTGIPGRNQNEQVLNFALTLEILEADLYRQALNKASGRALATALNADPSVYNQTISSGGLSSGAAAAGFLYLVQFAYVEAAHRDFLRSAISAGGGTPVSANPTGYAFPGGPANDLRTLLANDILPLEETGVRAYLGALPFLNDLSLAQTAGTIFSTEARHSAAISNLVGTDPGPHMGRKDRKVIASYPHDNTLEYFLEPQTVLSRASGYFV